MTNQSSSNRPSFNRPLYRAILLGAWLLSFGSACPERTPAPPAAQAPCTQFGQRCEYSPGKLGTCVKRDDCTGNDCYICQSQH